METQKESFCGFPSTIAFAMEHAIRGNIKEKYGKTLGKEELALKYAEEFQQIKEAWPEDADKMAEWEKEMPNHTYSWYNN